MNENPVLRATRWMGWADPDLERFDRFAVWLCEEAIPAGGLGPNEASRVVERHLVDSVLFAAAWTHEVPPSSVVDLGSGVGLPAVPLALLWPDTPVTAVERGGKRADLLRRATRILELDNLLVLQTNLEAAPAASMITMRAVLPPAEWESIIPLVLPGGVGVVAASPETSAGPDTIVVPADLTGAPRVFRVFHR